MEWLAIVLGILIGMAMISRTSKQPKKPIAQSPPTATQTLRSPVPVQPTPVIPPIVPQRRIPTQEPPSYNFPESRVSTKAWVETWRSSIVGLIRLSQRNFEIAGRLFEQGLYKSSLETALTSVENVSRALLHCYGEKPEMCSGQMEPLRLLSRRLAGAEKSAFEKTLEEIRQLQGFKMLQGVSECDVDPSSLLTKLKTSQALSSTSCIVAFFAGIIQKHFLTEIPELAEVCPVCRGLDVGVLAFSRATVNYTCNACRHSWTEPRALNRQTGDRD